MLLRPLLGVALLTAAPLAALLGYDHVEEYRRLRAATHVEALDRTHAIAAEYDRLITGAQYLLISVSRRGSIRTRDPDACRAMLIDIVAELQSYSALSAYDLAGRPFCATFALPPGETVANRPFFRRALASSGFAVGNAVRNRTSGRLQLPVALPFAGPDEQIAGVLMLIIDLEWQTRMIDAASGSNVVIADGEGTVIMQIPPSRDVSGRSLVAPLPLPLQDVLGAAKAGTVVGAGHDGLRRIWGYSPLSVSPKDLFVAAGIDEAAALGAVYAAVLHSAAVSLGALLLALAAGTFGGWLLLRRRGVGPLSSADTLSAESPAVSEPPGYAAVTRLTRIARGAAPPTAKRSG